MPGIDAFEQYASEYDAWFERNQPPYEAELRAVRTVLPSSGLGLEIGVGTRRFAAPLGIRAGIDPSPTMAAIARARGIVRALRDGRACGGAGDQGVRQQ